MTTTLTVASDDSEIIKQVVVKGRHLSALPAYEMMMIMLRFT